MTAQLSKVIERLVKTLLDPYLERTIAYGENQFAYRQQRGARDALALLVIEWILTLNSRGKVAVYCSDVAGAFDRVKATRLIEKLVQKGVHRQLVKLIESWLRQRTAKVVVGGQESKEFKLLDMIFQGTVLGPILWNTFFEDARLAIKAAGFTETMFADDLQAYKRYTKDVRNTTIFRHTTKCQEELHKWGEANCATFEDSKESVTILSRSDPAGPAFKNMGITFDAGLYMHTAIESLVDKVNWKLRTVMRTSRFFNTAEIIHLYKARILSFIEYRTAAIYHGAATALARVD